MSIPTTQEGATATFNSLEPFVARNFQQTRVQGTFSIGGVSLRLSGNVLNETDVGDELRQFRSPECDVDIEVNLCWADVLHARTERPIFESGATWKLFSGCDELIFEFASPLFGSQPFKILRLDRSFSRAEVVLSRTALQHFPTISPVEYPVCELLITNYLAHRGLGIEVHACGLVDSETGGHLFLGHSGAGKSTSARVWQSERAPQILSDDRIILRLEHGELWMYGTPWHGEAAFALPGKARLSRIHILRHGVRNKLMALGHGRAVAEVFARSFPPFHSAPAIDHAIEFLNRALNVVSCHEFQFVPDSSAVAAILSSY